VVVWWGHGAGKSTLIKVIAGVDRLIRGRFLRGSRSYQQSPGGHNWESRQCPRISRSCDNLDVVSNLFLGREEKSFLRMLDEAQMEYRTLVVCGRWM